MKKIIAILVFFIVFFTKISLAQWAELASINDSLRANNEIRSITCDGLGNIYTAGLFSNLAGKRYVAKWNGTSWSELGGVNALSANSAIYSLSIGTTGNVYAAGNFTNGNVKQYVAVWNGTSWSELGGTNALSANNNIYSVCADAAGNVYAAGDFTNASSNHYVAKWDGTSWSELGGLNTLSANNIIMSICLDNLGNLYAAGNFTNGSGSYYVAKWDGISWSELGGINSLGANASIYKICFDKLGNLYAAGNFTNGNGKVYVGKWDGTSWSELGGINSLNNIFTISSLCADKQNNVYASGWISNVNGKHYVAKYDGTSWSELGGTNNLGANNIINSIYSDLANNIYAGGVFTNTNNNYFLAKYTCAPTYLNINQTICSTSSYSFNNQLLTQSGTYYDTITNYKGCDSIITLNLTVNNCFKVNAGADYTICPVNVKLPVGSPPGANYTLPSLQCTGVIDSLSTYMEYTFTSNNQNIYFDFTSAGMSGGLINSYSDLIIANSTLGFTYYAPAIGDSIQMVVKVFDTLNNVAYDTVIIHIGITPFCDFKMHNDTFNIGVNQAISIHPYTNDLHVTNNAIDLQHLSLSNIKYFNAKAPKHGTIAGDLSFGSNLISDEILYFPKPGFVGIDSFYYYAFDDTITNNNSALYYLDSALIYVNVSKSNFGLLSNVPITICNGNAITIGQNTPLQFSSSYNFNALNVDEVYVDSVSTTSNLTGQGAIGPLIIPSNIWTGNYPTKPSWLIYEHFRDSMGVALSPYHDSVWLNMLQPSNQIINKTVCNGSGFLFRGNTLTTSGTYYDTLTNYVGCDSIITLNLIIGNPSSSAYSQSICSGSSYLFNGNNLTAAGIYKDTLVNYVGCDSIITLTLSINPISSSAYSQSICSGNSYLFNGNNLTAAGIYYDTLVNASGCDSIITLTLSITPTSSSAYSQSICNGNSYLFNGNNLTAAGIYYDTLINTSGCDSIVTLTLQILPVSSSSFSQSVCSTSPYYFNNQFLSVAGAYKDTLINHLGCDSIITLNLSIIQSPTLTFKPLTQSCFITTNCVSLNITASGGALPYNIGAIAKHGGTFNSTNNTMCWAAPTKDTITVIVTDNNGCSTSSSDTIYPATDCVWPGDANSDLEANQFDILPIGLGFGYAGPVRTSASLVWVDQPAMPFTGLTPANQPNSANWKHADCNGDGIINGKDTVAILQNFGLTHLRQSGGNPKFDKALPTLKIVFSPDTLYNGMQLTAGIELGNVTVHANNVYGFAFDYLYDALVTDTNSLTWSIPNSFMFTSPTDHISIGKNLKSQGVFKFGAIRNDHHPKSGYGTVLTITADILSGNIPGRINSLKNYIYKAVIQNLVIVDSSGTQLIYNIVNDSSLLLYQPKGIDNVSFAKQIKVYPNPANNFVKIEMPFDGNKEIKIVNAIGQMVYQSTTFETRLNLNIENYQNGMYLIMLKQGENMVYKRLVINR